MNYKLKFQKISPGFYFAKLKLTTQWGKRSLKITFQFHQQNISFIHMKNENIEIFHEIVVT